MFAAFIDMEKAYDKVRRAHLRTTLRECGVRGKLLGTIQALYTESSECVRDEGNWWMSL